jgi:K+-sensing histidine kinase KdpD
MKKGSLFPFFGLIMKFCSLAFYLGLSIAKKMVEACGGWIWVESEAGRGPRFVVAFQRFDTWAFKVAGG